MKNYTNNNNTKKGGFLNNINENRIIQHTSAAINYNYNYNNNLPFLKHHNIINMDYITNLYKTYNIQEYFNSLELNNFNDINDINECTGGSKKKKKGGTNDCKTVLCYYKKNSVNVCKLRKYCNKFYKDKNLKTDNNAILAISTNNYESLNTTEEEEVNYLKENLLEICEIIKENNTKRIIIYKINYKKINVDKQIIALTSPFTPTGVDLRPYEDRDFTRIFEYYDYNVDNILGYQGKQLNLYIKNQEQINNYINQQYIYIQRLDEISRRILTDYTRFKSFTLYQEYVKAKEKNFTSGEIVNNFLKTIKDYYPEKYDEDVKNVLLNNMGNAFIDIIEQLDIFKLGAGNYSNFKTAGYDDKSHENYSKITNEEWKQILEVYLIMLNNIIKNAPPVPVEFICYRGVSNDYTNPNMVITEDQETIPAFISTRTGSISLNYEKSKHYYDLGKDDITRTMYRILVLPGSKLLFVTPLAGEDIKEEMELITPSDQVFISNNWGTNKIHNNYKNKNNICYSKDDIINSKDLILIPPN